MIGERIADLRARVRLRRGNELGLAPRIATVERDLMDRRRTLDLFRDLVRNHADTPFERFEGAMGDARRACARTQWMEALDRMAAAAAALDSIARRVEIRRRLDEQHSRYRNIVAAVGEAGADLLGVPALNEPATLRSAAEQALTEGRETRAERLAAMHRSLLERWCGPGSPAGLRALATVAGLPSPAAPWRRLSTPAAQALDVLKGRGLVGLAGALALDVLARSDGWQVHDGAPLAMAGERLEETAAWVRGRLGDSIHPVEEP